MKEFAPAKVSVRHGADPALAAANSTSGTMYLARGRAEANATGKLLLVFGCALLVPVRTGCLHHVCYPVVRYWTVRERYMREMLRANAASRRRRSF